MRRSGYGPEKGEHAHSLFVVAFVAQWSEFADNSLRDAGQLVRDALLSTKSTMPRYRRRAVEAMSDHIEEDDDATQNQDVDTVDADEDEDEQPRPPRRTQNRATRERSSRGAPRDTPVPERDETDDAQDTAAAFDEDAFGNKPLNRQDGQRLHGMASDWNMIRTNLKESAFSLMTEVSTAVAEYADEDSAEKVAFSCLLDGILLASRNWIDWTAL